MSTKSNFSYESVNQNTVKDGASTEAQLGGEHTSSKDDRNQASEINSFLAGVARRMLLRQTPSRSYPQLTDPTAGTSFLPKNPWTIPEGYYRRPDDSVICVDGSNHLRKWTMGVSMNGSTEALVDDEKTRDHGCGRLNRT